MALQGAAVVARLTRRHDHRTRLGYGDVAGAHRLKHVGSLIFNALGIGDVLTIDTYQCGGLLTRFTTNRFRN